MSAKTGSNRTKRLVVSLVKVALSATLLAFLFYNFDLASVAKTIRSIGAWPVLIAALILVFHTVILSGRSYFVLSCLSTAVGASLAFRVAFIGVFFNQLLPSAFGGDAVRAWLLGRSYAGYRKALSSILLERLAGVLAMVILGILSTFLIPVDAANMLVRWSLIAGLVVSVSCIYTLPLLRRLPGAITKLFLVRHILAIADDLSRLSRSSAVLALLSISILLHIIAGGAFMVLLRAAGAEVSFLVGAPLVSLVLLVTVLPLSFGSWGLREGAAVAVFQLVGVAPDAVLAASILFGVSLMAASTPGMIFWFLGDRPVTNAESSSPAETKCSTKKENFQW